MVKGGGAIGHSSAISPKNQEQVNVTVPVIGSNVFCIAPHSLKRPVNGAIKRVINSIKDKTYGTYSSG